MKSEAQIVRLQQVIEITGGLSASTIYRMERAGTFPARLQLGPNSVGWRLSEVSEWVESRLAVSAKATAPQTGKRGRKVKP